MYTHTLGYNQYDAMDMLVERDGSLNEMDNLTDICWLSQLSSDKQVLGNREAAVTCDWARPQILRVRRFITRFLSPYPKRNVKTRPDDFCKYPENIGLQFWLSDAEAGLDSTLRRG